MTVTVSLPPTVVNTANLGGDQLNAKSIALPDGGYLVAWNAPAFGTTIWMQRFDGLGNPAGAAINTGFIGSAQDIALTANGNVALAMSNFASVLVAVYNAATLALIGASSANSISGANVNGLQIDPVSGDTVRLMFSETGGTIGTAIADPSVPAMSGVVSLTGFVPGTRVLETAPTSNANVDFGLLSNGVILDSTGNGVGSSALTTATDLMRLQTGFYVVMASAIDSPVPRLTGVFGNVASASSLAPGITVVAASIAGLGTTTLGAEITAREMVNLGEGRILMIWGAFRGGVSFSEQSGVYASVYNATTGSIEGNAVMIRPIPDFFDLQDVSLLGTLLADGRVAVGLTLPNGLSGSDVFQVILDPRIAGVTVTASAGTDTYVGTNFDDTFLNVGTLDTIFGGNGNDSVTVGSNTARQIDLITPEAFVGGGPRLVSIENVTTGNGEDLILGSAGANILNGMAGNDVIDGRGGNDSLIGGIGNDTLQGGTGDDTLDGGANDDMMLGGRGLDVLLGGSGNDTLRGDAENDLLIGGDNDDVLFGGAGDDTLYGGSGNDKLVSGDGDDQVFGGLGDDLIFVQAGGYLVAGEGGNDTASFARTVITPVDVGGVLTNLGVMADLTGNFDQLAAGAGFSPDGNTLTGIENLVGSRGNDFLAGDAAANRISGGIGNDTLFGRDGADTLTGGDGADTFVFDAIVAANDQVRDFTIGADKIALLAGVYGDIDAGNIASRFFSSVTAAPGASATAQFLFDNGGPGAGRLLYDADGNGAGAAVLLATVQFTTANGLTTFGAGDFVFL